MPRFVTTFRLRTCIAFAALLCVGCSGYVVPGGPAPLQQLVQGNDEISIRPAPPIPARIAVVRIQAPEYESATAEGAGEGEFSVVSPQEWPDATQLQAMVQWPAVSEVLTLDLAQLSASAQSLNELRLAAAKLRADVLMIYTLDTSVQLAGQRYRAAEKLGPVDEPEPDDGVISTASAVLTEVRTGYSYGAVDANAKLSGLERTEWTPRNLDQKRLLAEQQAFTALLDKSAALWKQVTESPL